MGTPQTKEREGILKGCHKPTSWLPMPDGPKAIHLHFFRAGATPNPTFPPHRAGATPDPTFPPQEQAPCIRTNGHSTCGAVLCPEEANDPGGNKTYPLNTYLRGCIFVHHLNNLDVLLKNLNLGNVRASPQRSY